MSNRDLFIAWNKALCAHFFPENLEKDAEVSLYIDRDTIDSIGKELGGYDGLMKIIGLSVEERQDVYRELRGYCGMTPASPEQNRRSRNDNIFNYATIYIDKGFYSKLECPFLVYIVFIILMASECTEQTNRGIGNYITDRLRVFSPNYNGNRDAFVDLFNALADQHPQFHAQKITKLPYIGLVRYQLVLSGNQVDALKRAMYFADISEDVPYETWAMKIRDYVNDPIKKILENSLTANGGVLRKRISDLRYGFDPIQYWEKHKDDAEENSGVKGSFVLAVYEDPYDANADRLVLLTDINNKDISEGDLTIKKGDFDRLGEYAEYNINHVQIGDDDKAEMKPYKLSKGNYAISSVRLGNIVSFSRSSNYLIQTEYQQKGKETYILVKNGHDEDFNDWLQKHGSPKITKINEHERLNQIFGAGWDWYTSNEIEYVPPKNKSFYKEGSIVRGGGIECMGKNNVYLVSALPYFEFPGPIDIDLLNIAVKLGEEGAECQYTLKVVDGNKLVVDLSWIDNRDHSLKISIDIEYRYGENQKDSMSYTDTFYVINQDVKYTEDKLWAVDMWGSVVDNPTDDTPSMKGFKVNRDNVSYIGEFGKYLPSENDSNKINVSNRHFYLVNLIAAVCSMREDFTITETWLKKCIRYAASRFDVTVDSSFYKTVRNILVNSGYINANYDKQRFQPIPPTFIRTPVGLFMLVGIYTDIFLSKLNTFCSQHKVPTIVRNISNNDLDEVNSLMPPVILLNSNFDPNVFVREMGCQCQILCDEDVVSSMMKAMPSYDAYEKTMEQIPQNVFDVSLENPEDNEFPRIRESRATRYGSLKFIEKTEGDFYRIKVSDPAWANLYCLYRKSKTFCISDPNSLMIRKSVHLPVMMQRMLFLTNFGTPQKRKAFICFNDEPVYYNVIKRYVVNESTKAERKREAIRCITGGAEGNNPYVRNCKSRLKYQLYLWYNNDKFSKHPRSLLVLTDEYGSPLGFSIKNGKEMKVYLRNGDEYRRVNCTVHNEVFSTIMTSKAFSTIMTSERLFEEMGITFTNPKETVELPPADQYNKEKIEII